MIFAPFGLTLDRLCHWDANNVYPEEVLNNIWS